MTTQELNTLIKIAARGRRKKYLPVSYPDYRKTLATQYRADPNIMGLINALKWGALGSVGSAAIALLLSNAETRLRNTLLAAAAGLIPSAALGYYTGKHNQESINSKLLALRRFGIDTPAELELLTRYNNQLIQQRLAQPGAFKYKQLTEGIS